MSYSDAWKRICGEVKKDLYSEEKMIQKAWEILLCFSFGYDNHEIDSQRRIKMGSTEKKADIIAQKDGKDLFVVELKRYTALDPQKGRDQLFSYLNQLKVTNIGIVICESLYIYYYDYSQKNSFLELKIPFEEDNEDGVKFVELFSKDNFSETEIRHFITEKCNQKKTISEIKTSITQELIKQLLKDYFVSLKSYALEVFEKAVEGLRFSVVEVEDDKGNFACFENEISILEKKTTTYLLDGSVVQGHNTVVREAVQKYVDFHKGITYSQLQAVFPDDACSPGFGRMLRRYEEVAKMSKDRRKRFTKDPVVVLSDGCRVYISTQWKPDSMKNFIKYAEKAGMKIEKKD